MTSTTESNQEKSISKSDINGSQKRILLFLESHGKEWTPKVLAKKIDMNYHTCRGNCLKLYKQGYLERSKPGRCVFYRLKQPYENELFRLSRTKTTIFPEIHNLQLYRTGISNQIGGYRSFKYNFRYHHSFGFKRDVTVLFGEHKDSITIWLKASDNPLCFEDFKHFLTFIEGVTGLAVWRDLSQWSVLRYGLNVDNKRYEESPQPTIVLSSFSGWFAQQYDKELWDGSRVRRTEVESRNKIRADDFIALVQGGMTNSQIMNLVAVQNKQIDQLRREFRSFLKWVGRKLDTIDTRDDDDDEDSAAAAPVIRGGP